MFVPIEPLGIVSPVEIYNKKIKSSATQIK